MFHTLDTDSEKCKECLQRSFTNEVLEHDECYDIRYFNYQHSVKSAPRNKKHEKLINELYACLSDGDRQKMLYK